MRKVDHTGKRFGRLTVKGEAGIMKSGHKAWLCICDCGNETIFRGTLLTQGVVVSCGCYRSDRGRDMLTIHGNYGHPLYQTWIHMKERCEDENNADYHNYGGRGITICERWLDSFENFITDMGERPDGMSLDRIDVNGNYEPKNCRWADAKTQANNTRRNLYFEYGGETLTLAQWSDRTGINYGTLLGRINRNGMSFADAISTPVRPVIK